ncbi:carboxymuconolactone decarboxylase family protein [Pueribacillus sp. YX66]|uniref:carboxymuconolactone decarboxylase family protein n=1 Tax=Pueribacillus sp. YX66 TaxID=3229242 RepID=UPI00358D26BD
MDRQHDLFHYKEGLGKLEKSMPELVEHYNKFTESCFAKGQLSQKQKQLIALGISTYAQDEYCIIYHTKGCLEQGCSKEEIFEVIGVSTAIGGGVAMSQGVTLVQQCIEQFNEQIH